MQMEFLAAAATQKLIDKLSSPGSRRIRTCHQLDMVIEQPIHQQHASHIES